MKLKNFLMLTALIASASLTLLADEQKEGNRFYVEGDLLYWNAHISDLELSSGKSSIVVETSDGITTTSANELDVDPHFKWKAGYRIAGGCQFDSSPWTLSTLWTHFQDTGIKKLRETTSSVNTTKCRLKLDQIDLILAYDTLSYFYVNFKPFIGIRGTKIHEGLNAFLVTDILYAPSTPATLTRSLDDREKYKGVGPIFGCQGIIDLGYGINLYGTLAAALLYGNHKIFFKDSSISTSPISKSFFSKNKKRLHTFDPNIDLALGVKWNLAIWNCYEIALKLSFEHHQYFNNSHLGVNKGDLTLDGGVFGIDLFF